MTTCVGVGLGVCLACPSARRCTSPRWRPSATLTATTTRTSSSATGCSCRRRQMVRAHRRFRLPRGRRHRLARLCASLRRRRQRRRLRRRRRRVYADGSFEVFLTVYDTTNELWLRPAASASTPWACRRRWSGTRSPRSTSSARCRATAPTAAAPASTGAAPARSARSLSARPTRSTTFTCRRTSATRPQTTPRTASSIRPAPPRAPACKLTMNFPPTLRFDDRRLGGDALVGAVLRRLRDDPCRLARRHGRRRSPVLGRLGRPPLPAVCRTICYDPLRRCRVRGRGADYGPGCNGLFCFANCGAQPLRAHPEHWTCFASTSFSPTWAPARLSAAVVAGFPPPRRCRAGRRRRRRRHAAAAARPIATLSFGSPSPTTTATPGAGRL